MKIGIKRFGVAWGITFAILYLGCVVVMTLVDRETTIFFFNSLFHGLNVEPILRLDMPWWEMVMGIIETFILGWLTGATIASIYNFSGTDTSREQK